LKNTYYIAWVSKFYSFIDKTSGSNVTPEDIERFLKDSSLHHEDWQINQANDAIRLYLFFIADMIFPPYFLNSLL